MTIMNSANFRTLVSPIMCSIYDSRYDAHDPEYPEVFKVMDGMKSDQHVVPVVTGFGVAREYTSGTPIEYDTAQEIGQAVARYKEFGLAFSITKTLVEDGEEKAISFAKRYSEELAISHRETEELEAVAVLNRAFNAAFPVWDGVSLINSAHLGVSGATYSNVLATPAALSQTSLEQILTQIRQAVDFNGKRISIKPDKLVVPPALMNTALVLLKSAQRAGTANNDVNPIKAAGVISDTPHIMTRLTSSTNWFVTTKGRGVETGGLLFLNRRKLDRDTIGDFETNSMRFKATRRYVTLAVDPKRIYGTPGV